MAEAPLFIQASAEDIVAKATSYFESLTNKTPTPAQTETLLLRTVAYLVKTYAVDAFNDGARKMLLSFSEGPILDYIVELLGVYRLAAQPAACTLQFAIIQGHTGVTIPQGTRVASGDGKAVFATLVDKVVAAGTYVADVAAEAVEPGEAGNGYTIGAVNVVQDTQPFIVSATNSDVTAGGSAQETDARLIERAKLAPNQFTTAGSYEAYKYHALSAHPDIVDVEVLGPPEGTDAGTVEVYPLVRGGGATPTAILNAVDAALNAKKVRPLCDTVDVITPTGVDYDIDVALVLYNDLGSETTRAEVEQLLNDFSQDKKGLLGYDIMLAKLTEICMQEGVYKPIFTLPAADVIVARTEYANIGSVNVTIDSYTDG